MREETILKDKLLGNRNKDDIHSTYEIDTNNTRFSGRREEEPKKGVYGRNFENKALKYSVSELPTMSLSEGIYLISQDYGLLNLPDPQPTYCTKKKAALPVEGKENAALMLQKNKSEIEKAHEKTEEITKTSLRLGKAEDKNGNDVLKKLGSNITRQAGCSPEDNSFALENIAEIRTELNSVKALLEKEKHEKQMLAAKLKFCTDFLLQLYEK